MHPMLPDRIPIFPLRNVLLLPHGRLPLNIFEPRYLAMTEHALGHGRIIGMVRPRQEKSAAVYEIGCAGRISSFSETDDGRYLITLTGETRFVIKEELSEQTPFRQIHADYSPFVLDRTPEKTAGALKDKADLLDSLMTYLNTLGMKADWSSIEEAGSESLVNSIAMSCPFSPEEKQALLEAKTLTTRAAILTTCLKMAVAQASSMDQDSADAKKPVQ